MGEFFHVLVQFKDNKRKKLIFRDLSKKELQKYFVKPFKKRADLFHSGKILRFDEIYGVKIIQTEANSALHIKEYADRMNKSYDRMNSEPGTSVKLVYRPQYESDIEYCGSEVTSRFIQKAPSNKPSLFVQVLNQPWTIRIVGGIILALLLWFIAKKFGLDI